MKKNLHTYFVAALLFFLITHSSQSQTKKDYYKWFDNEISTENTGLFNGIRYKENYRVKNGKHKFYLTSSFIKGDIVYDNQIYFDIEMKYDLHEDQIIVNLFSPSGNSIFKLINNKIKSFTINKKNFVNLKNQSFSNSSNFISGFYEILFKSSSLILYKKNKKIKNKFLESDIILYEFKSKDEYYIFFNKNYYLIKSKNNLTKLFSNNKKEINNFYNKNKLLLESDKDLFMKRVSQKINSLIN